MDLTLKSLLVFVILLNFVTLGSSRMRAFIRAAALQGMVLGVTPLFLHEHIGLRVLLVCLFTVAIKGVFIPSLLFKAMREVKIRREVEPLLGFIQSLLLGALGTALAVVFSNSLPLADPQPNPLLLPTAFSTIWTGCLILTTRTKAVSQVVGYLILENGIFVFGLLLLHAVPFLVEVGVLLDLLVGIFIMGIILNQIQRTFSSLDTQRLSALKE